MATARAISRPKRSVSRYAVAPGVTTIAMTRNAPTVCSAATVEADSSVKNSTLSASARSPIERAWLSSEEHRHQVLPEREQGRSSVTPPMIASCSRVERA